MTNPDCISYALRREVKTGRITDKQRHDGEHIWDIEEDGAARNVGAKRDRRPEVQQPEENVEHERKYDCSNWHI